jgi:hypothetical protein
MKPTQTRGQKARAPKRRYNDYSDEEQKRPELKELKEITN